ncbi:MAG: alanine--tRNA ligase, partial [Anaerolineales bacterium]|nr:alanine--tRNA ligase [Anaerolineales bacterium]
MKPKTTNEVRQAFLEFFEEHGHQIVDSSPLPNRDNPTLLFTNAGMNQFTDVFLGNEKRDYSRAVTCQKVMRVQGKHNDLENVGPSPRHHTFFEMLGNFSFGDYFKKEAIAFAWQFLTDVVGLDKNRLWVTIYLDDDEADELWQEHISKDRILRFGEKDNFWSMGDVGPCGPCSEIHYYWGPIEEMNADGVNYSDEYLELWNLVFMQFDRDGEGNVTPLPRPSIDTGMSLERIVQVLQNQDNNYDTDAFSSVLAKVQELLNDSEEERQEHWVGYRVIADHGRAATFLIADGVLPGNTGEGYVLRMIIRRAARFGRKIGFTEPFLGEVAKVFIKQMGSAYPDLPRNQEHILHTLRQEEERFARTLDGALGRLQEVIEELHLKGETVIPGDIAFDLYSTHGLPLEITRDVAGEHGYTVDEKGYEEAREIHAGRSGSDAFGDYQKGSDIYRDLMAELVSSGRLPTSGVDHDPYS